MIFKDEMEKVERGGNRQGTHHLTHSDERALSQTLTKHTVQIRPGERNRILTLIKRNVIDDEKEKRVWQQSFTLREVRMHHTKSPIALFHIHLIDFFGKIPFN
jgi:hypothetical protein